jgi:integrase
MPMGRHRLHAKHLPRGVTLEWGSYYYRGADRRRLNLGRDFADAMAKYGQLFREVPLTTFGALCDKYQQSIEFTTRSERTRKDYLRYLVRIRATFCDTAPRAITAPDVLKFRDLVAKKSGVVQANRHLELLKLLLRLAVAWGVIPFNPAREIKKFGKQDGAGPREQYATDDGFAAVYKYARPAVRVAMDIALLTGLRRENLVQLSRRNDTAEGLKVKALKGGKWLLFKWTPELRAAIDRGYALWPRKYPTPIDQPIILAKGRKAFTGDGLWQAFAAARDAAIKAEELAEPFTLHDIRAKSSSDTESLEVASARLGHMSTATTERVYRRKAREVEPLR